MSVASQGINVSPQNSSIVALGIGATFTGVGESALDFAEVDVVVYATPSNAAGTLYFEFSPDNTNWDVSVPLTITDPTNYPPIPLRVVLPFFRVRYVNGGVAQSAFRLSTVYHHLGAKMLTRFPGQTLTDAEPLEVVTAVLRAQNPAGAYTTLMLDSSSRLTTTTGVVGGGTEAAAQRVTIANDSTGVLSVDDNGGSLTVDGAVTANAGTNLNTSALALETTQTANGVLLGAVIETAPATDTASSGLNGRLQRIAQRLTSLIALLPSALVGGRLDTNNGAWLGSTAPTVGLKTAAASLPVIIASDQGAVPVSGPLTDAQLRATAVPISGSVSATSTATASNSKPQYTEAASSALSQTLDGRGRVIDETSIKILDALSLILAEVRVHTTILHQTLNSRDEVDSLRAQALSELFTSGNGTTQ